MSTLNVEQLTRKVILLMSRESKLHAGSLDLFSLLATYYPGFDKSPRLIQEFTLSKIMSSIINTVPTDMFCLSYIMNFSSERSVPECVITFEPVNNNVVDLTKYVKDSILQGDLN